MSFKEFFFNRHNELRVGWRLLAFLGLLTAFIMAVGAPLAAIGLKSELVGRIITFLALLAATYIMVRFANKKPFGAIGLSLHPRMFREFGMGCLLGLLMMAGIFIVELLAGFIQIEWRGYTVLQTMATLGSALFFFAVAAFLEELLFRGYAFQTVVQWITFLPATLGFALLFSYAHYFNPNVTVLSLVNVGLAGVWLSLAYMKTRSLWLPFGLHVAWNFSQTAIFSFPTSGAAFQEYRLADVVQGGPEWITGGAFGPEGGVLATIALLLSTWYILKSGFLKAPEGIVTLDSVEDLIPPKTENEAAA
jgi:membrane protease YdiL (CAAX protease family)